MIIKLKLLQPFGQIPTKATDGSAAFDLYAAEHITVPAHGRNTVALGIAVAIPATHFMSIVSRSGMYSKCGIRIGQGSGTIDADYRGEVKVMLENTGDDAFYILPGDRIAQALILPVPHFQFDVVEELDDTARGAGGFGSTGVATALLIKDNEAVATLQCGACGAHTHYVKANGFPKHCWQCEFPFTDKR